MTTTGDDIKNQLIGYFFEEAAEGLEIMESGLLALNPGETDRDEIDRIFRAMHSIKGAAGSFGFAHVSNFAHVAETLLDKIRDGERRVTQEAIDVLLQAVDCIRLMVDALNEEGEVDPAKIESVSASLGALVEQEDEAVATEMAPVGGGAPTAGAEGEASEPERWSVLFRPDAHLLASGNEPIRIFRELAELGQLSVTVKTDALPTFRELDPETCQLAWEIGLETAAGEAEIREVFAWVEGDCELRISVLDGERTRPTEDVAATEAPTPTPPKSTPEATRSQPVPATIAPPVEPTGGKAKANPKPEGKKSPTSIRVSTDKVDELINQVGELVITQSMLGEAGENFDASRIEMLREGLGQLARNTRELQESVMRIRMLPISVTFGRFPRVVRDVSQKLGKEVDLEVTGEGTELDKNVLEQIGDPLVHLVRNALDHGIEPPQERIEKGKPARGRLGLNAFHEGGSIVIEVTDDGAGLDVERIRAKAIERGLIGETDGLSEPETHDLLFQPGFSTAEQVSDVSGRGVGMDVVRRNIKELGGAVTVTSRLGEGSTFTIRLPLTLAILDGQLVRVGEETYIVPLIAIVESLQIKTDFVNTITGGLEVYRLRDEAIPILRLCDLFGIEGNRGQLENRLMVVVEAGGRKTGLIVDELLAQQQVVIKSLEANYRCVPGLSGATILGNGTVALIVDVAGVVDSARRRQDSGAEPSGARAAAAAPA